jgi:ADP-ribosylglycohydrolase
MPTHIDSSRYLALLSATALGDSLGLPYENMPGKRVRHLTISGLRQRFVFGRYGVISDDTEHALITARALMNAGNDTDVFERGLSRRLKRWLQTFPPGVGKATLFSIMKMWFVAPSKAGYRSAGNGPLMRAPIIGFYHASDEVIRDKFVVRSTRMTHRDPRALFMASGIADIVAHLVEDPLDWPAMSRLFRVAANRHATMGDAAHLDELALLLEALDEAHAKDVLTLTALESIGGSKGIDGYCYRSALAAAYIASHSTSVHEAIEFAVSVGGDTDSTAAIAAAIASAAGKPCHPYPMVRILDWPVSPAYLEAHARALSLRHPNDLQEPAYIPQLLRNIVVVLLDMGHILRRLLPPY